MAKKEEKILVTVQPLLVDVITAARMCGISKRYFLQLDDQGKIPRSLRLGKRKLWRVSDLQKWIVMGCPIRKDFESK